MFPIDSFEFFDGGFVFVDSDVAVSIVEASIAPAIANDEKCCRLSSSFVATCFLPGTKSGDESLGKNAGSIFKGSCHCIDDFGAGKDVALHGVVLSNFSASPRVALFACEVG